MGIYINGRKLFMIMDAEPDFDHEAVITRLAKKPLFR
jgi:hypothetical protein